MPLQGLETCAQGQTKKRETTAQTTRLKVSVVGCRGCAAASGHRLTRWGSSGALLAVVPEPTAWNWAEVFPDGVTTQSGHSRGINTGRGGVLPSVSSQGKPEGVPSLSVSLRTGQYGTSSAARPAGMVAWGGCALRIASAASSSRRNTLQRSSALRLRLRSGTKHCTAWTRPPPK